MEQDGWVAGARKVSPPCQIRWELDNREYFWVLSVYVIYKGFFEALKSGLRVVWMSEKWSCRRGHYTEPLTYRYLYINLFGKKNRIGRSSITRLSQRYEMGLGGEREKILGNKKVWNSCSHLRESGTLRSVRARDATMKWFSLVFRSGDFALSLFLSATDRAEGVTQNDKDAYLWK